MVASLRSVSSFFERLRDGLSGGKTARVSIGRLVSPLRYDILVRAQFFRFHRQHSHLYEHSRAEYLQAAQQQPYFVWFREVYARRFQPQLLSDPGALTRAYADRVQRSVELFRSFELRGFDRQHPIVLRTGNTILATETGKVVPDTVFAGNGCHRLALLLDKGHDELDPGSYVLKRTATFRPLDNTALLLSALQLSDREYDSFLARRYGLPARLTRQELLSWLAQRSTTECEQTRAIIAIDDRYRIGITS